MSKSMGPFKAIGIIFGSIVKIGTTTASASVAILESVETIAEGVNSASKDITKVATVATGRMSREAITNDETHKVKYDAVASVKRANAQAKAKAKLAKLQEVSLASKESFPEAE